jgi:hypothetical protein
MSVSDLALEHLLLRLQPVNRALRRAVEHQRRLAARLARPDAVPLCVTDDQVEALLGDVAELARGPGAGTGSGTGTGAGEAGSEAPREEELRRSAAETGRRLPLEALAGDLGLTPYEVEALLLCAAVDLDRSYERIYAFVLDDLNRRFPCVELLAGLTARSPAERLARFRALGPYGRLRRHRLLVAGEPAPTALRQELQLGPGVLDFLLTGRGRPEALFRDPDHISLDGRPEPPPGTDLARLSRLGRALDRRELDVLGVWAERRGGGDETVLAVLAESGRPVRRLRLAELPGQPPERRAEVAEALRAASALAAVLWIATEPLTAAGAEPLADLVAEALADCRIPVVLSGRHPWRPTALLAARTYAELEVEPPDYAARQTMWTAAVGELPDDRCADLAARLRLGPGELRAAIRVARTQAWLAGNGRPAPVDQHLEKACAVVTRRRTPTFASVVEPRRRPEDLVLTPELHRQVLEIARFYRAWPRVAEDWGFGRLVTGGGGIKALFTGDSGTGKTLAAEVIAHELRVPLVKVDLARVVSKWVGETEKNLAAAFEEAEDSHSVLFFDEADALFGKRGEVEHGTDRYANLEVSYLLQRLEDYGGLVILASNLKDNIDPAFTRRFQVTLNFPRPAEGERRRIWAVSLPAAAPVAGGLDFDVLARLDMTGGSISGAARSAALLAAADGAGAITMRHVVQGVTRQYQREARLLRATDLGAHAALLREPA